MDSFKTKELITKIPFGEFDYTLLSDVLQQYKKPRNIISRLLKNKEIIRVKKGLYVYGEKSLGPAYQKEILANMIYGPSYISLEYALSYYGLIPERVETITSITNKKNKTYQTPIGHFSYRYLNNKFFTLGLKHIEIKPNRYSLMASPEKALIDFMYQQKQPLSYTETQTLLFNDLRIDRSQLKTLSLSKINHIAKHYTHPLIHYLKDIINTLKHE